MTEAESNLMTQVLDLRRERAEARAEVERLREDTGVVNALRRQRDTAEAEVECFDAVHKGHYCPECGRYA